MVYFRALGDEIHLIQLWAAFGAFDAESAAILTITKGQEVLVGWLIVDHSIFVLNIVSNGNLIS